MPSNNLKNNELEFTQTFGTQLHEIIYIHQGEDMTNPNEYGEYLEANVILLKKGFLSSLYQLAENGSVIKVHNAYHFRKVWDQFNTPPIFPILADMRKVTVITGSLPLEHIRYISFGTYVSEQSRYL